MNVIGPLLAGVPSTVGIIWSNVDIIRKPAGAFHLPNLPPRSALVMDRAVFRHRNDDTCWNVEQHDLDEIEPESARAAALNNTGRTVDRRFADEDGI